jgi:hypothetical protein
MLYIRVPRGGVQSRGHRAPELLPMTFKPWDVPPPAEMGDSDENTLFMQIGRAPTEWEQMKDLEQYDPSADGELARHSLWHRRGWANRVLIFDGNFVIPFGPGSSLV